MNMSKYLAPRVGVVVCIILCSFSIMYLLSARLFDVSEYDHMISSVVGDDGEELSLPFTSFLNDDVGAAAVNGEFTVSLAEISDGVSIYIPYFVGSLKLSVGGAAVFLYDEALKPMSVVSSNSAVIDVPLAVLDEVRELGGLVRFSIELRTDRGGLATISQLYFGDVAFFERNVLKLGLYFDILRAAMLGGQISLLLLLLSSTFAGRLGTEAYAPITVLIYFVLGGLGKYSYFSASLLFVGQIGVSLTPLAIVALFKLFSDIRSQDLDRPLNGAYYWFGAVALAPAFAFIFGGFDLLQYNKFVSAPLLLFGTFFLSVYALWSYVLLSRFDIAVWAVTSSLTCYAVFYDVFFRFGIVAVPTNFATLAIAVFSISIGATYAQLILSKKLDLANLNREMQEALDRQGRELAAEFQRTSDLKSKAAAKDEVERLTSELHDGVLTYLSMISSLSENGSVAQLQRINILSRSALNEIRIILEARPSDLDSLTIALGALRSQLVDPLLYMGVEVEWSTAALLEQGATEPKVLMEIIRIVQEAVHNAVIRGECKFLSIVARRLDSGFSLTIMNKGGRSFSEKNQYGMGILNMKNRALSIGSTIDIEAVESGAIVTLIVPSFLADKGS